MSTKMLGASSAILDQDEMDKRSKAKDNMDATKKASKSIKSFFQPQSPESVVPCKSTSDISSFFKPRENTCKKREGKSSKGMENSSKSFQNQIDETKLAECREEGTSDSRSNTDSKILDKCQSGKNVAFSESNSNIEKDVVKENRQCSSSKKTKQKWSLIWRVSSKSKLLEEDPDFEEDPSDVGEKKTKEKVKKKTNQTEKKDEEKVKRNKERTKEKCDESGNGKGKKKLKKENVKSELEAGDMEDKNMKLDTADMEKVVSNKNVKSELESGDIEDKNAELEAVEEKHVSNKNVTQFETSPEKKVTGSNAFEILMRCKRQSSEEHNTGNDVSQKEMKSVDDEKSTITFSSPSKSKIAKISQIKETSSDTPVAPNAFVLLMRKKSAEKVAEDEESVKRVVGDVVKCSKKKSGPFKLNICYSKNLKFDDYDDEFRGSDSVKEHTAKKKKKEKANKVSGESKTNQPSECMDMSDLEKSEKGNEKGEHSKKQKGKKKKTLQKLETDECYELTDDTNIACSRTKIKDKGKATKKNKDESTLAEETAVYISDNSNLSVQEILENQSIESTPRNKKSKKPRGKNVISSDSDDFERIPTRSGLRKRFIEKKDDSKGNEEDDHDEVGETMERCQRSVKKSKEVTEILTSPEVQVLTPCKGSKAANDSKKEAQVPQKLASIFLPRQKALKITKPGDGNTTQPATSSPDTTQSTPATNDEKSTPYKFKDPAELAAENKAFNALFSGSRALKSQLQQAQAVVHTPAPWPKVSHVLQKSEEEEFWSLVEPNVKSQDVTDNKQGPSLPSLHLGDLTDSCSLYENHTGSKFSHNEPFSTSVVKRLLTDLAAQYPGIPLRRLYKRYKAKEDANILAEKPVSAVAKEDKAKQIDAEEKTAKDEPKGSEETNNESGRRGRSKRKLSIESEKEPLKKQKKKKARKEEMKEKSNGNAALDEAIYRGETSGSELEKRGNQEGEREGLRRRSSRLRKPVSNNELEEQNVANNANENNAKRKKRKTMEDDLEEDSSKKNEHKKVTLEKLSSMATLSVPGENSRMLPDDDSRMSQDGTKRGDDSRDLPWTDRYKPVNSSEVMGNGSAVGRLRTWLENWKIKREKTLRKELELQKRLLAKQKKQCKASNSSQTPEWWEEDSDSDFRLSDAESDDSDTGDSGLCNAMLVVGPKGAGKTATVYACARELGYKVFEVNCSSKRNSKQILSQLEEATQSHLVITNPSANTPHSSAFGGLFGSLGNKNEPASKGPMSAFFKQAEKQEKPVEKSSKKKSRKETEKPKDGKGKKGEQAAVKFRHASSSVEELKTKSGISIKAASLILFEEVDVIFEEDRSFWSAVNSFMRNTKCPIIMTCTDPGVECEGRYEQLTIRAPSTNLLSAHLQLTALTNNMLVHPEDLKGLVALCGNDIRQCLLALQFWLLSGGGEGMRYSEYLEREKAKEMEGIASSSTDNNQEKESVPSDPMIPTTELSSQGSGDTMLGVTSMSVEDPGEESMFLSLDDWKTLRQTRARKRTDENVIDAQNSDSDFESSKTSYPVATEDTNTESMMESQDLGDSQSMQVTGEENPSIVMPDLHCGLLESALGLLNCARVTGSTRSWATLLKDRMNGELDNKLKTSTMKELSHLATHCQHLGINIIDKSIVALLPKLFVKSHAENTPERAQPKSLEPINPKKNPISGIFSDKNLFDDGCSNDSTSTAETKEANIEVCDAPVGMEEPDPKDLAKSTDKESGHMKQFNSKALEIFSNLAEDASFMNAFVSSARSDARNNRSEVYGWWQAWPKAGLSDDVINVRDHYDWLMGSRLAGVRGAMEVASYETSYLRYIEMIDKAREAVKDTGEQSFDHWREDFERFLPAGRIEDVIDVGELPETQRSSLSSRLKLYRTTSGSFPLITTCSHRAVCTDYLPTLRTICHSEHLRETANTKRRFLHYLNSNSFPFTRATTQSLATAYLG